MPGAVNNANESLPFEVKRCEVLPSPAMKCLTRIRDGGKAPRGRIADRSAATVVTSPR